VKAIAMSPGVGGIILSGNISARAITQTMLLIDKSLSSDRAKLSELRGQQNPRFLFCVNPTSILSDDDIRTVTSQSVDSYYMQVAFAPVMPQIDEFARAERGEKLARRDIPAGKVPVRIMLQNAILGNREGFVNLDEAVEHYLIHDLLFGHSEVLDLTGITDEELAQLARRGHELRRTGKITGNLLMAVGEVSADRDSGRAQEVVAAQVRNRLQGLTAAEVGDTVIAYEPRWAIGTGRTPTAEEIRQMHRLIRNTVKETYGNEAAEKVRIIYGGSLNLQNAEEILKISDVDGACAGGASTNAKNFRQIVGIGERIADSKNAGKIHYRKMFFAGNHKTYPVEASYEEFVRLHNDVDKRKVEVSVAPDLANLPKLIAVYTKDALEGIVNISQLTAAEKSGLVAYVRPDWNMPIDDATAVAADPSTWRITNYSRIDSVIPEMVTNSQAGIIQVVMVHFEPKGTNLKGPQSIRFLMPVVEERLRRQGFQGKLVFINQLGSREHQSAVMNAQPGDILVLENLRLDPAIADSEKSEIAAVRNQFMSRLLVGRNPQNPNSGVVRVNMGMGVMHRDQASVTGEAAGIPMLIGDSLAKEFRIGTEAVTNAKHPIIVLFGGGPKIGDKVPLFKSIIANTLTRGDSLVVHGGAALPFLMVMEPGFEAGLSKGLVDPATLAAAEEVIEFANEEGVTIIPTSDFVVADRVPVDASEQVDTREVNEIPATMGYYDIGSGTVRDFHNLVFDSDGKLKVGTIIGNGPSGMFEYPQFSEGTRKILEICKEAKNDGATVVLGGADTGAAVELLGFKADDFSLVSTGGGAFLELLQGLGLPGVEVLRGKAGQFAYKLNPRITEGFDKVRQKVSDYTAAGASSPLKSEEVNLHFDRNIGVKKSPVATSDNKGSAGSSSPITAASSRATGSSPLDESKPLGGIDFRVMPMTIRPLGTFSGLDFSLPKLSKAELEKMNLDTEMRQISNMVENEMIPSGQRVKELVAACAQKGEMNRRISDLIALLAQTLKLEEETVSESSPELRELLVIVDSQVKG